MIGGQCGKLTSGSKDGSSIDGVGATGTWSWNN